MYARTSCLLVNRTFAIFRSAEFGFLGVAVVTLIQIPLLCGQLILLGAFLSVLNVNPSAGVLDFFEVFDLGFLIS
jgi:hypothetical protein